MPTRVTADAGSEQDRTSYRPAFADYFADPFVFQHDGIYYAVGTGPGSEGLEIPMLCSHNFVDWHPIGCVLEKLPELGDCYWAPEVAYSNGAFYMYFSVGFGDKGHHLRVATSDRPEGPYRDIGRPLLDRCHAEFAIDASPFQDADGQWYLFYSRDFLDSDNGARPGTALVVSRLITMVDLEPEFQVVMRARHDWQRYQSKRSIYNGIYDWHTLEGPFTVRHNNRYYCLYSGGNWQNQTYGVDWVVSNHPMGPYTDTNDGMEPRLLITVPGELIGPGHNSVVVGPDGVTQYLAFHAWDLQMTARRFFLEPLGWNDSGPICLRNFSCETQ